MSRQTSGSDDWEAMNARHLASALQRLKGRLEHRAAPDRTRPSAAPAKARRFEGGPDAPPALERLSETLGLSPFERDVLLLCAAAEYDSDFPELFARVLGDPGRTAPTFALALSVLDDPAWDALSPERPLRFWKLIEINQPGAQPLTSSALRADERIVNHLKGLDYLDDRLAPFMAPVEPVQLAAAVPASQTAVLDEILRHWTPAASSGIVPVVQLQGADAAIKQRLAGRAADRLGRQLHRLQASALPAQAGEIDQLARLWRRESRLLPLSLHVDAHEVEPAEAQAAALRKFLLKSDGFTTLAVREAWPRLSRETRVVDVTKPTMTEQRDAWQGVFGPAGADGPAALAGQFDLDVADIASVAAQAGEAEGDDPAALRRRLWDAARARVRPMLDTLAQRIEPKATFDDIVLPAEQTDQLRQIAAQVTQRGTVYGAWGFAARSNRGLGISALFAGDSGTGKTMAAEVIADALRLNLYRIDLSAVVSKYIGETEKNLRRLFDAAEDGGAILFFDEADALFGKRSEVKDSHDRYANIEINYLLQRVEGYRGLAILATNMRGALDTAFLRRLRFIVSFPFPGAAERRAMWEKAFPRETPLGTLDLDRLARLNLTGGSIHNAALNAAFLAARDGSSVTMPLALAAARAELVKLDRPINESDFRWLETAGAGT